MNTKIILGLSVSFNAALLGALTYVCQQIPEWDILTAKGTWAVNAATAGEVRAAQANDLAPKPGEVIEAVLPETRSGQQRELFDLETGRRMPEPVFDYGHARESITWIRNSGLDISGLVLQSGKPVCIGFYLAVVPVNHQLWNTITPGDLSAHPELMQMVDAKRPFIVPTEGGTDTFLFRTVEGTTGVLQVRGVTEDGRCVKIRYKLLSPGSSQPGPRAEGGR